MDSFAAADVPSSSSGGGVVGRDAGEHGKKILFGAALSVAIPSSSSSEKKELKMQPPVRCSLRGQSLALKGGFHI